MEETFKKIEIEKQDRIINSALEEFSKNSFEKASTNNIVKNAEISKGLLYHYFGTKKKLYEFLKEFTIRETIKNIEGNIDWDERDLLLRIKEAGIIKLKMTDKYPYIFNFFAKIFEDSSVDEMKNLTDNYSLGLVDKIYTKNIDFSIFRDDIDRKKIFDIINWTFEKYGEKIKKEIISNTEKVNYKVIEKDIDEYIEVFKKLFYKGGSVND
ncbi:MAG: TetR/AcrR family transcriptional regulator [Senegalia sp. (in: firmicutes)]|uniref:TetR/AcrR family transcriptional regulator n=1 Tax=Senegalia sp. (in: firmicutes) TaxID=1924098 RepID=UPI003F9D538D